MAAPHQPERGNTSEEEQSGGGFGGGHHGKRLPAIGKQAAGIGNRNPGIRGRRQRGRGESRLIAKPGEGLARGNVIRRGVGDELYGMVHNGGRPAGGRGGAGRAGRKIKGAGNPGIPNTTDGGSRPRRIAECQNIAVGSGTAAADGAAGNIALGVGFGGEQDAQQNAAGDGDGAAQSGGAARQWVFHNV